MSRPRPDLTTTSFAVLGLLSLRPASAYELVGQARRSLRHFWPRAERQLYEEPKRLEALGLVVGHEERTGKRVRTVYEITDAGRRALREWFASPSAPAQFESEAVLKASLGDLTTKERLLQVLREARAQAEEGLAEGRAIAESILGAGASDDRERLHVVAVMYEFVFSYFETMARWARWAEEEVGSWPDTSRSDDLHRTLGVFRRALIRSARLLPKSRT
ncbi:MAG TPA: PadR family transcriptional regulator [Actinomycetota bacterium]|nr:PadR family transcriptional regulator [Actinomycetota bacterium]